MPYDELLFESLSKGGLETALANVQSVETRWRRARSTKRENDFTERILLPGHLCFFINPVEWLYHFVSFGSADYINS